jgi:hypothetical protein
MNIASGLATVVTGAVVGFFLVATVLTVIPQLH